MQEKALFADAFLVQPSIIKRLGNEFVEASSEFREDPKGYLTSAFKGDGIGGHRRKMLFRFGFAIAILVFSTLFLVIVGLGSFGNAQAKAEEDENQLITMVDPSAFRLEDVKMPESNKKAGGGGGGGRNQPTPASKGQLPKFSLTPPLIAPTTRPTPRPPSLPVMETVQVDPRLEPKRDELAVTGLPTGVPGPPSDGPGSGGGIGTGSGGGVGSGRGTGVGPGEGYNMGGGGPQLGGRPGGNDPSGPVDSRPVPLNRPRPNYTEEARKNKIQGVVQARVLVGADGVVKQVRVTRGLPDGLSEQAIQAAYQIRFKPATRNGQPVSNWVTLAIEFNLR